ncbi:hypothetical protein TRAPUB_544 [Trametes pubescens]|uniref:Uncharacterized protein n=1 Tax=Trametes pubescens TaxID=154538 RepID=A0A1M2VLT7_TRAPU|nr:hypothetical protein TRAPUB_544 [Trametes pubescens]
MTTQVITRAARPRPKATAQKKAPQPTKARRPVPRSVVADTFSPTWAAGIKLFSTISGAFSLTVEELQTLKNVPRDHPPENAPTYARVARSRSIAMASRRQRIEFRFQGGPEYLPGQGMPVYVLATVPEMELYKYVQSALDTVMQPLGTRKVRIRIQWPCPRDGKLDLLTFEESVEVDASTNRLHVGMLAAEVFWKFFESYRTRLVALADYSWLLRPDALHRVWLIGLERVENDVFAADLRYVKDYPETPIPAAV